MTPNITTKTAKSDYEVVAIGCSTGCAHSLKKILSNLPADFPLPILIATHLMKGFGENFIRYLRINLPFSIKFVEKKEFLKKGTIYFHPEGEYMLVQRENDKLVVSTEAPQIPINECYTNLIDRLFESIALAAPGKAIGGILSGLGEDGALGLLKMKNAHCFTFVQDKASCVAHGMPEAALQMNALHNIVNIESVASVLITLTHQQIKQID